MDFTQKFLSEIRFDSFVFIYDILLPCILALIFGGLIGFQREKAERPAGLRTHTLVCLGSTVFTLISYLGFSSLYDVDPSRIAAGIVTGIGFIGAGVIFRQGPLVKGVTTAASIWVVASVGMALGAKLYYLAILVTILGFITLSILKYIEDKVIKLPNYLVRITTSENFTDMNKIISLLKKISVNIKSKKYELAENNKRIFTINLFSKDSEFPTRII
ncbi:MAG: MgtC/SapB family protein, partial [Actinobacteria bacterium]|nr:MgtC/SapB family protein [Actinomycetota bacterium]